MLTPTNQPNNTNTNSTTNPLKQLIDTIFSYDGNVMLAALVSLLLVILFVLILHVYAKWFLAQAHHRRRGSSMTVSRVLGPNRFQHFHTFTLDATPTTIHSSASSTGLDPKAISAIPLFVYKTGEAEMAMEMEEKDCKNGVLEIVECVICLTPFEDNDVGRNLPKCGHCFHVECIDMWLGSHTNCPICRAPVMASADGMGIKSTSDRVAGEEESVVIDVSDSGFVSNRDLVHVGVRSDSESSSPSSSSSPLMVGCSLKRMLSRNKPEMCKVFQTANGNNDQMDG